MPQMSPGAWLQALEGRLDARRGDIDLFTRYRDGNHRLRYATAKFRQAFAGLFNEFADNWCELVVEAPVERLKVQGFRFDGPEADKQAWAIWQHNNMDATSDELHRESITCGEAYWLVEPPRDGAKFPTITAEHPSQVIVAHAPGNRKKRLAALKKWVDIDGYGYANLYLPTEVFKYKSQAKHREGARINWDRRRDDPGGPNPLGEVPVVPIVNSPSMLTGGRSDLRNAIPLQDAINKTVLDAMTASEFAAFPQRVVLGVEAPKNPDGTPIANADVKLALSKLLMFTDSNAKIDQFQAADLSNYTTLLEPLVHHFAGQTRTPPQYLLGQMVNVSGDALIAAESGLVARTTEKHTPFGEGHEETMRLAAKSMGKQGSGDAQAETIWSDPQFRNFGQLVDGLVKLRGLNIPDKILWERAGFSPTEIARIETLQEMDNILVEPRSSPPVVAPTATVGASGTQQVAPGP